MTDAIYTYAMPDYASDWPTCWLAQFSEKPCAGRMDHAHLIAQQNLRKVGLGHLVRDPSTWVPACRTHHFDFDAYRGLVVPREAVPPATVQFAERHDLISYLDRRYGVLV